MNMRDKVEMLRGEMHDLVNGLAAEHYKANKPLDAVTLAATLVSVAHDVLVAPVHIAIDEVDPKTQLELQNLLSQADEISALAYNTIVERSLKDPVKSIAPAMGALTAALNFVSDYMEINNEPLSSLTEGQFMNSSKTSTPDVITDNVVQDFMESIKDIKSVI